jgi:hypothetical protein
MGHVHCDVKLPEGKAAVSQQKEGVKHDNGLEARQAGKSWVAREYTCKVKINCLAAQEALFA